MLRSQNTKAKPELPPESLTVNSSGAYGRIEFSWKGTLLNGVVLVLISMGAFVYGINLQMPVWPAFIAG